MTETTTTAVEETATPAVETETEAQPTVNLRAYDWDAIAVDPTADASLKMLANMATDYFTAVKMVEQYDAINNLDDAVASRIATSTDPEDVKAREEIEKARAAIEKREAQMEERARKALVAAIDPNFDEQKNAAHHKDARLAVQKKGESVREVFKVLGHLTSELSEAKREGNWKATDELGAICLAFLKVPKLGGKDSKSGSGASEEVKEFNRNAKEYGRKHGMKVADKGALSLEVKEAYSKASGVPIPSSK